MIKKRYCPICKREIEKYKLFYDSEHNLVTSYQCPSCTIKVKIVDTSYQKLKDLSNYPLS